MGEGLGEHLKSLIMPTLVLGLGGIGLLTRLTRNSVLEVLREDYITTARAKGVKEYNVIYKHALRNALLPVVTVIGLQLAFILSGAVLVETVFAWPGMGRFFVLSANRRDYTTLMGINLTISVTILMAMLVTDIAYAFIDPRIKY
jgi:peptide/nickel transport system permease protein